MLPPGRARIVVLTISLGLLASTLAVRPSAEGRAITWALLPDALQQRLARAGIDRDRFVPWLADLGAGHADRVREGDEDAMVFYALQSTRTTRLPIVEPALSARALVASLDADSRARLLADPASLPASLAPRDARARLDAFVQAVRSRAEDERLAYFGSYLRTAVPGATDTRAWREAALALVTRGYFRAMRFLHEQDRAGRTAGAADAVASLYRRRGLSTDTSVEAGFAVRVALSTLRALEPQRRLRHVVIVGPGLDLAPRTGLNDATPPQSLQPFAVADALLALGFADVGSLQITCVDINPRVVAHLERTRTTPMTLTLTPGMVATETVTLSDDFLDYVAQLGGAIGAVTTAMRWRPTEAIARRWVKVRPEAQGRIQARVLDIVTERLDLEADAVIVTNVLPYFDDRELTLALTNIHAMLGPRGVLIHNEARPEVGEITAALGLPLIQGRTAILARVRDAAPLYDGVFIHRKN